MAICPTGADIDFFLIENAPPMGSAPPAALTVGASTVLGVTSPESLDHQLRGWLAALAAFANQDWATTPIEYAVD